MKTSATDNTKGPVAVIAVHGVADQTQDETAAKAVDLLLHLDGIEHGDCDLSAKGGGYEGFREEKIRVGVTPLDVSSVDNSNAWSYQLREHLEDYEDEGRKVIYESSLIEGERIIRPEGGGEPVLDRKVHVYELHWADVSKLKFGIFNLFAAIYRLLFETSWLGKQVIGKWSSFGSDVGKFSTITSLRGVMLFLHAITTMVLTRFMPVIYLLMISMLMLTAVPALESQWASALFAGMGGYDGLFTLGIVLLTGGFLVYLASFFWRRLPWPPVYLIIIAACFLVANLILALLHGRAGSWWAEAGLAVILWIGMSLFLNLTVFSVLNRVFPGTRLVGNVLIIFFTVGLVFGLCHKTDWPLLISGPLHALRLASAIMPIAWIVLATAANLFLLLAMFELFTLWFRRDLAKEVRQKRRSRLRSAVVSITLPVLLVSFLNAAFFQLALVPAKQGGLDGVRPIQGRSADAPEQILAIEGLAHSTFDPVTGRWSSIPDFEKWSFKNSGPNAAFSDYANFASSEMVIPFMEVIFLLIILVLGYSLWIVTPAVWAERNQPVNPGGKKWENLSVALGKNLTQGYSWIWLGQVVLVGCLLVTQALFAWRGIRSSAIDSNPEVSPGMVLVDQFLGLRNTEMNTPLPVASVSASKTASSGRTPHQHRRPDYKRDRIRQSIEQIWQRPSAETYRSRDSSPISAAQAPAVRETTRPSLMTGLLTEAVVFLNNGPLTSALGFGILILGVGYLFFSRLADPLVTGLRGGLDMALDVVSYLHPFPKNRTTRAQILNRYASLLQHIAEWRDPQNPEIAYSRIVIITHSQGGVITSDLLRALSLGEVAKVNGLGDLGLNSDSGTGIPIRLLSMGSPLVQLYNARFPDLYDWDRSADPRENHKGLECWWNLYRSGDYVGRMIFRDKTDKNIYTPGYDFVMTKGDQSIPVRETCIGPGAHTHYWGANASASVIQKLDYLIACDDIQKLSEPCEKEG